MTITVSDGGVFKSAQGAWVSNDGAWQSITTAPIGELQTTVTTMTISSESIQLGQPVDLVGTVKTLSPVTQGELQWLRNDEPLGSPMSLDLNGQAYFTDTPSEGLWSYTASYLGSEGLYKPSKSQSVNCAVASFMDPPWKYDMFGAASPFWMPAGAVPELGWSATWNGSQLAVNVPPAEATFPSIGIGWNFNVMMWPATATPFNWAAYPDAFGLLLTHDWSLSSLANAGSGYVFCFWTDPVMGYQMELGLGGVVAITTDASTWESNGLVIPYLQPPAPGTSIPAGAFCLGVITFGPAGAWQIVIDGTKPSGFIPPGAALDMNQFETFEGRLKRARDDITSRIAEIEAGYDSGTPEQQARFDESKAMLVKFGLLNEGG